MGPGERDPRTSAAAAAFDLNAAVAARRAELAQAGLGAGELDELEDHLRAQFAELLALGLNGDEAWLVAERRLGPPREIGREFGTIESRLPAPLVWMTIGFLLLRTMQIAVMLAAMYLHRSPSPWMSAALLVGGTAVLFWSLARTGNAFMTHPGRTLAILLLIMLGNAVLGALVGRDFKLEEYGANQTASSWAAYMSVHLGFWCLLLLGVLLPLAGRRHRNRGATP